VYQNKIVTKYYTLTIEMTSMMTISWILFRSKNRQLVPRVDLRLIVTPNEDMIRRDSVKGENKSFTHTLSINILFLESS